MKGLIQVFCKKVDKRVILYQVVYKKTKKKTDFYIISKYLIKDNKFNYDLYIINIIERKLL